MKTIPPAFVGRWRITSMKLWAQDMVELDGPAILAINADGDGSMKFIAVSAWLDCERAVHGDVAVLEFAWEGTDDGDPRSGRGWVTLGKDEDHVDGSFSFYKGDTSLFKAERFTRGVMRARTDVGRLPRGRRRTTG